MIYGYARVSTRKQQEFGTSLADQVATLKAQGCEKVFQDAYTGTKIDRPQFTALLKALQPGDTLIVTKLDRFARNAHEGASTVQALVDKGVNVNILNMGLANNTPMGKLLINVMFAFAEFERDMIVQRTQDGRAAARQTRPDYKEGRHRKDDAIAEYLSGKDLSTISVAAACRELGICRSTWYNYMRDHSTEDPHEEAS